MYRNRIATLSLSAWIIAGLSSQSLLAQPAQQKHSPRARRNINGFLELGWKSNFAARNSIDAAYSQVRSNPETSDVVYAYVIAKIKQRQYRPAREAITLARKMSPQDLHICRTELWLDIVMRQFDPAMMEADRLSKQLVAAYQPFAKLPVEAMREDAGKQPEPVQEPGKPGKPDKSEPAAKPLIDKVPANVAAPVANGIREQPPQKIQVVALPPEQQARKQHIERLARFIGIVMAYLDHPYRDSTAEETRQTVRDRIEQRLVAPGLQQSYRAGYRHVVSRFMDLGRQVAFEGEQAKRQFDEEKALQAQELDQLKKDLADREKSVIKQQEKLNADLEEESKKLRDADDPLREGMRLLESRAADVNRDMTFVASDLARARARHRNARDDTTRDIFANEIFRLQAVMARLDADLWSLQRQAADVQGQRFQLASQDERNRTQHRRVSHSNQATLEGVDKVRKQSQAVERRLERQKPKAGRVRAIGVKIKAFSTYTSFPLEGERIRLLED